MTEDTTRRVRSRKMSSRARRIVKYVSQELAKGVEADAEEEIARRAVAASEGRSASEPPKMLNFKVALDSAVSMVFAYVDEQSKKRIEDNLRDMRAELGALRSENAELRDINQLLRSDDERTVLIEQIAKLRRQCARLRTELAEVKDA